MNKRILFGVKRFMLPIPRAIWQGRVTGHADLGFMSADHQRVRNYVVCELPHAAQPLPPEQIAAALDLSVDQVVSILTELEEHMTFLYRNSAGAVAWAYPVTCERTPHRVTFSSGEQIYAA